MAEEEQKLERSAEVEDILSDLDTVLTDMGLTGGLPPLPVQPAPAPKPVVDIPAPKPAPAPKIQGIAPVSTPVPKPVIETPAKAASPASSNNLQIELGTVMGISNAAPPASAPPASAVKPPLEIKLDSNAAAKSPETPAPVPISKPAPAPRIETPVSELPASKPVVEAAAPKPVVEAPLQKPAIEKPARVATPVPVPVATVTVAGVEIPENLPKDQIRTMAFLYPEGSKSKFEEFIQFIDSMAQHLTKKPLYLKKSVVMELPDGVDPQAIIAQFRASGAAGIIGLLPEATANGLEDAFLQADVFFRSVRPEDVGKRSAALDLLVDVTLLAAG